MAKDKTIKKDKPPTEVWPTVGGSYQRDPVTGELTPLPADPTPSKDEE